MTQPSPGQVRDVFTYCKRRLQLGKEGEPGGDELRRFGVPCAALKLLGRNVHHFAALPSSSLGDEADASVGGVAGECTQASEEGGGGGGEAFGREEACLLEASPVDALAPPELPSMGELGKRRSRRLRQRARARVRR